MARSNKNGQLQIQYYKGFGGKSFDSIHYANAFRMEAPYHFGMQVSKMFSAMHKYDDKIFTNLTYNRGSYETSPTDVFKWTLSGDSQVDFTIMENLESSNSYPGKGRQEFRVALDKGWISKPAMLQWEDNNMPRGIIQDDPIEVGGVWYYTVKLETDDPNVWLDPENLKVGKTVCDAGTRIQGEMNQDAAGSYYNSQMDLQSQIGMVAREFNVTDKVVRMEMAARKNNGSLNNIPLNKRSGEGYAFAIRQDDKIIPGGAFITMAEAKLLEKVDEDIELDMIFGNKYTDIDATTGYVKKSGAGWRQLVQDGHVIDNNGSLTAQQLEDYLHGIFLHRLNTNDRKIKIATGEGGMRMFHQILSDEANSFLTLDTNYIKSTSAAYTNNALAFGAQFTKFVAINGIEVELIYDPMKDNRKHCKISHPDDSKFTRDSFRMDIYDFGTTDQGRSNMCMVMEENVDLYAYTANVVDPVTGVINSGAKVSSFDKGVSMRRERSGGLNIWDTSRIGSIIFEPEA